LTIIFYSHKALEAPQLSGQLQNSLSGQKNPSPNGLNSYNFGATDFDYTTGSKPQKLTL
jgi:hypothetical protein